MQALVSRHHAWCSTFWVPDREAYRGLGDSYVLDHRFQATYDKFGDGTAQLLRDAIHVWADAKLG